jgi:hypothetical protein
MAGKIGGFQVWLARPQEFNKAAGADVSAGQLFSKVSTCRHIRREPSQKNFPQKLLTFLRKSVKTNLSPETFIRP